MIILTENCLICYNVKIIDFPRYPQEDDVMGEGSVSDLIFQMDRIRPDARPFTEIQLSTTQNHGYIAGTSGILFCIHEKTIGISLTFMATSENCGRQTECQPRAYISDEANIKWVIHPSAITSR